MYNNHTFNNRDKRDYSYSAILINKKKLIKAT